MNAAAREKQRLETLRKTLYPLSNREIGDARVRIAYQLRLEGRSFREIRQIMGLTGPDKARGYVAKGVRIFEQAEASLTATTGNADMGPIGLMGRMNLPTEEVIVQRPPAVLRLNLKGCFFDAIKTGEKTHEYRLASIWEKRIQNYCYRVGIDEILLLRGYPAKGDESRMLRRVWNGYTIETIQHPHFGDKPVRVLAIDVTRKPETIQQKETK